MVSFRKNGGGALNPRPLVSAPQNPFVFQQPIGRKFPTQKRTFAVGPLKGNRPKAKGRQGAGYRGAPCRGEALRFWLSAGPCAGVCPWGGARGAGPGGRFAPSAPQPVPAAASLPPPEGPRAAGVPHPTISKGKVYSPPYRPRIKE